jgi:hypothetical protein
VHSGRALHGAWPRRWRFGPGADSPVPGGLE